MFHYMTQRLSRPALTVIAQDEDGHPPLGRGARAALHRGQLRRARPHVGAVVPRRRLLGVLERDLRVALIVFLHHVPEADAAHDDVVLRHTVRFPGTREFLHRDAAEARERDAALQPPAVTARVGAVRAVRVHVAPPVDPYRPDSFRPCPAPDPLLLRVRGEVDQRVAVVVDAGDGPLLKRRGVLAVRRERLPHRDAAPFAQRAEGGGEGVLRDGDQVVEVLPGDHCVPVPVPAEPRAWL
eukprot:gene9856-biopygen5093